MKHFLTTLLILTWMVGAGQNGLNNVINTPGVGMSDLMGMVKPDTLRLQKGTITAGEGIIIVRDTGSMITIEIDPLWAPDTINSDSAYWIKADTISRLFIGDKGFDTIPVMLMVCDTSSYTELTKMCDTIWSVDGYSVVWHGLVQVYKYKYDDRIYWINGYQVRKAYTYWGGPDTEPGQMMVHAIAVRRTEYKHIKYLDAKKQPIKPEIVVWDYRRRHTNSTSP